MKLCEGRLQPADDRLKPVHTLHQRPLPLGFGVALIGEAIVFPHITMTMLILTIILWAAVSLFVVVYEEPTLRSG